MIKKFLVIGSNSFSGSHFVARTLEEGYQVVGVSRSKEIDSVFLPYLWNLNNKDSIELFENNFSFHKVDLNSQLNYLIELVDNFKPTHIVNFAAQGMVAESWLDPTHWFQTNVLSQVALHDELRKKKFLEKYIHVTTPEVYGSTDNEWIKEDNEFSPSTPYAVSRASCDLHLRSFYDAYQFPVVFTRAANVYGPGQQLYRVIPRSILSAKLGKSFDLHGGGTSERSFIHISDVVNATLKLALGAEGGSTWHISTENSISIKKLVEKIFNLTSGDFENLVKISNERLGKDQSYLLDSSALRSCFKWEDEISLEEGLSDTVAWIDKHLGKLKNMSWKYNHKK